MITVQLEIRQEYATKLEAVVNKLGHALSVNEYAADLLEKAIEQAYYDFVVAA